MSRIDKSEAGLTFGGSRAWRRKFFTRRLSRRQIRELEEQGKQVVFGKCWNCGFPEAIKPMHREGDPYCRRCSANWRKPEDGNRVGRMTADEARKM